MRARNRDNARRTRKRKKLYIAFLNNALEALENVLNPKEDSKDNSEAAHSGGGVASSSSTVLEVHEDETSQEQEQRAHFLLYNMRLPYIREFLRLRSSPTIFPEQFLPLCLETVIHSMPLPAHRDLSSLASIDASGGYECRGIDALVDDTRKRASFCDTVSSFLIMQDVLISYLLLLNYSSCGGRVLICKTGSSKRTSTKMM